MIKLRVLIPLVLALAASAAELTGPPVPIAGWRPNPSLDGTSAIFTHLSDVNGITVSPSGAILVLLAESTLQIDLDGTVRSLPVAGAMSAGLDSRGNLYYATITGIYQVDSATGVAVQLVGGGAGTPAEGLPAAKVGFDILSGLLITGLAVNPRGEVFFTDSVTLWRVDAAGQLRNAAAPDRSATGEPLVHPASLASDSKGNIYVSSNSGIVKVQTDGRFLTLARLDPQHLATHLATDSTGNVFFTTNQGIQRLSPDGFLSTIPGSVEAGFTSRCDPAGRVKATQFYASGLAVGPTGNLLIAEPSRVREITPAGDVRTIAGEPPKFTGDGGLASAATLAGPAGLAFDAEGSLYIADSGNNRIRKITPDGIIRTIAGDGGPSAEIDFSCGVDSELFLNNPRAVALDAAGNLYIADTGKNRLMRRTRGGVLARFAEKIQLVSPRAIGVSRDGNIYVGDNARRTLVLSPDGAVINVIPRLRARSFSTDAEGNLYMTAGFVSYLVGPGDRLVPMAGFAPKLSFQDTVERPSQLLDEPDAFDMNLGSGFTRDSQGALYDVANAGYATVISPDCGQPVPVPLVFPEHLAASPQGDVFASESGLGLIWRLPHLETHPGDPAGPLLSTDAPVRNAASQLLLMKSTTLSPGNPIQRPFIVSSNVSPDVAPGEIVRITGQCLGPFETVFAPAAGIRLFFDGLPAPLLSVQAGEILAVTPFALSPGKDILLRVEVRGVAVSVTLHTAALQPGLFRYLEPDGSATVVAANHDGTPNSRTAPAEPGSVMWLYATGLGQINPPGVDGQVIQDLTPQYLEQVKVTIGGAPAEVIYVGPNPGFTGLAQIFLRVPAIVSGPAPVVVQMGSAPFQQSVQLWVK